MNTDPEYRINLIRQRLKANLNPSYLDIQDLSHAHANHPQAQQSGGGHFKVYIISSAFSEKPVIERHKMIYLALGDALGTEIHALSITAKTPAESQSQEKAFSQEDGVEQEKSENVD